MYLDSVISELILTYSILYRTEDVEGGIDDARNHFEKYLDSVYTKNERIRKEVIERVNEYYFGMSNNETILTDAVKVSLLSD